MKRVMHILNYFAVLTILVACSQPTKVKAPEPCRSVAGPTQELAAIDTLMWRQPDSAFAMLQEFAGSEAADSLDVFEGHYCQVLIAELLYKNYYKQSNRKELVKAVHYFDSVVGMDGADIRGKADARGASVQRREAFLAARAHYINGVGYYERDSLIEACGEYLNALQMMEGHFTENELVGTKARFMALTYTRLMDMFSQQFIQEQAVYCGKQSLAYNKIAHSSPGNMANILYHLGKQYDKLNEADSAAYYYEKALETMPDRNSMLYRDVVTSKALFEYNLRNDTPATMDSLKRMAALAATETERLTRFLSIGCVYQDLGLYDSAKVYLEPVFENKDNAVRQRVAASYLHEIYQSKGDTVKANQYAQFLIEDVTSAANSQARVSQLNDLFQKYLQEKQEKALAMERLEARRRILWLGGVVALLAIMGLAGAMVTRRSHRKRLAAQEAEAQRRLDEASQRLSEASQRHDAAERELQTKVEQATLHTKEVLQQRAMALYHGKEKDKLQRILAEFDGAYPKTYERMMAAYPDLSMQEYELCVLGYFDFRAKEIAQLMDLQEGTVYRYRSTIRKKTGADDLEALMGRFLD